MIRRKYTLREALEKRLLEVGEYVNIEGLYTPYKTIPVIEYNGFSALSLESYFSKNELKMARTQEGPNGTIEAVLEREDTSSKCAKFVASKLLSDDTYNIKATGDLWYKEGYRENWRFLIVLNPDIIVRFEGVDEEPYLELPPHTAYTF